MKLNHKLLEKKILEKLNVKILELKLTTSNHYRLKVLNPKTGSERCVFVSKTPKPRGRCIQQVISDIRKAFSSIGECVK